MTASVPRKPRGAGREANAAAGAAAVADLVLRTGGNVGCAWCLPDPLPRNASTTPATTTAATPTITLTFSSRLSTLIQQSVRHGSAADIMANASPS
jgi:hypothetical protein